MSRWNAGGPISFAALWLTVLALSCALAWLYVDVYALSEERPETIAESMQRQTEVERLLERVEQLETNGGKQ